MIIIYTFQQCVPETHKKHTASQPLGHCKRLARQRSEVKVNG